MDNLFYLPFSEEVLEVLRDLTDTQRGKIYTAIAEYQAFGILPQFKNRSLMVVFRLVALNLGISLVVREEERENIEGEIIRDNKVNNFNSKNNYLNYLDKKEKQEKENSAQVAMPPAAMAESVGRVASDEAEASLATGVDVAMTGVKVAVDEARTVVEELRTAARNEVKALTDEAKAAADDVRAMAADVKHVATQVKTAAEDVKSAVEAMKSMMERLTQISGRMAQQALPPSAEHADVCAADGAYGSSDLSACPDAYGRDDGYGRDDYDDDAYDSYDDARDVRAADGAYGSSDLSASPDAYGRDDGYGRDDYDDDAYDSYDDARDVCAADGAYGSSDHAIRPEDYGLFGCSGRGSFAGGTPVRHCSAGRKGSRAASLSEILGRAGYPLQTISIKGAVGKGSPNSSVSP